MGLIDLVLLSNKRQKVLQSLLDKEKDPNEIVESTELSWALLREPIKKLKEDGLIIQNDNKYSISNLGKLMFKYSEPLLKMEEVFEKHPDYWINRNLSVIPKHLVGKIGELGDYTLVVPEAVHVFEPLMEISEEMRNSKRITICLALFNPELLDDLIELAKNGVELQLLTRKQVHSKILNEHRDQLVNLLNYENVSFSMYSKDTIIPLIAITDTKSLFIFFNQNDKYDYYEIISSEKSAQRWAMELFSYYAQFAENVVVT
ncbi:helix-turn-helix transcriptional regulator [Methanococcoides methylutens]|uniref:helix-turn-helix transcriptional regulator n=1 Tax=Methanococcoides methylutens TaxID=2226 RepID=UPI0040446C7E